LLVGSFTDVLSAEVPKNYVITKDIYSLKDEPEIIWKEELVVYDKYDRLSGRFIIRLTKITKNSHHIRCLESVINTELMFLL